jgi:hypothetical protein
MEGRGGFLCYSSTQILRGQHFNNSFPYFPPLMFPLSSWVPIVFPDICLVPCYRQRKHLGCRSCPHTLEVETSGMVQTLQSVGLLPSMVHSSGSVVWSRHGHHCLDEQLQWFKKLLPSIAPSELGIILPELFVCLLFSFEISV